MKELSIEEKAQRYDGAIKRANAAHKDEDRHLKATLERIFPELKESKESEDENIRKRIIQALHGDVLDMEEISKCTAWLEKQGTPAKLSEEEQNRFAKGVLTSCAMSFIDYLDAHKYKGKMCVSNGECEDIENAFLNAMWDRLHRYYCKYIEKQGEHKEDATCVAEIIDRLSEKEQEILFKELNMQKEHNKFIKSIQIGDQVTRNQDGMLVNLSQLKRVAKPSEKQGEKKPADKVESKFKVGDWVVYDHRAYQVVELPKEGYINLCLRRNGKIEFAPSPYCRHWTIKDAKNGDVLSYKDEISLYKHDIENCPKQETTFGGFVYHCCYDGKRFITDSLYSLTEQDKMDIHLATKEQRDLLFQKMKESGYEWDAEKKKLKEIEEEVNGEDYGIDSLYHAQRILEKTLGKVDGYQSDDGILEHKCAISAIKKLYEQKPAWSEEDINMIDWLIRCCEKEHEELCNDKYGHQDIVSDLKRDCRKKWDWLESLKNRVVPQKQWKPTEEQIKALEWQLANTSNANWQYKATKEIYKQLKQL